MERNCVNCSEDDKSRCCIANNFNEFIGWGKAQCWQSAKKEVKGEVKQEPQDEGDILTGCDIISIEISRCPYYTEDRPCQTPHGGLCAKQKSTRDEIAKIQCIFDKEISSLKKEIEELKARAK